MRNARFGILPELSYNEQTSPRYATVPERKLLAGVTHISRPRPATVVEWAYLVAADYPRPDLAIEIDISSPQVDRQSIYADLGIFEVWRFVTGQKLIIEHLQADGSYAAVEESRFLRIRGDDILAWLTADDSSQEPAWNRRLNRWAMALGGQA